MGCRITNLLQGLSITKFFMPFAFVFITILHLISTAMDEDHTLQDFLFLNLVLFPPVFVLCYAWILLVIHFCIFSCLRKKMHRQDHIVNTETARALQILLKKRKRTHTFFCRLSRCEYEDMIKYVSHSTDGEVYTR